MIFVNRPYLFTVDQAGQLGSKIELFIWNGDTPPTNPNYTFTKQIASATDTANYYNISPFLAEFIEFGVTDTDSATLLDDNYFVNYRIKNYYLDEFGDYQPLFIGTPPTNKAMYGDFGNVFFGGLLKEDTYYTLGGCDLNNCDTISVTYTLVGEEPVTVEVDKNEDGNYYLEINENTYQIVNNGTEWELTSTEETACDVSYSITYTDETGEYTFCLNQTGIFNGSWEYSGYPDVPINRFWRLFYNSILQRWFITTTTDLTTIVAQSSVISQTICPPNNLLLNWEIGEDYFNLYSISTQNCINSLTQATLSSDTPCPFGTYTIEPGSIFSAFSVAPSGVTNKFLFPLITNFTNKTIRWTDLYNNATETEVLTANKLYSINGARYANGTKVEFLNNSSGVVNTWTFLPKCECTYEPIKVQYLNTYGALITTWFYKANKKEFSMENSEFKRFQTVDSNFYVGKQRQTFNTSAREKITVNSDWVLESYSQVIKDIITSEYILVNDKFANIETKSIEIQQNINNGLINYQLTFTYSNDYRR